MAVRYGIIGLGKSGLAVAAWCQRNGYSFLTWDDANKTHPTQWQGKGFPPVDAASKWIVSPGVPPSHPLVTQIIEQGHATQTDVGLFCERFDGSIVGITGTNGKTTVAEMTAHRIAASGQRCAALGNVGRSPLDFLDENLDTAVLELSSFQLYYSGDLGLTTACLTNLAADHLDWHRDQTGYFAAKARIFSHSRYAVVNGDDDLALALARESTADVIKVCIGDRTDRGLSWQDDQICWCLDGKTETVQASRWDLRGQHNRSNAGMALAIACTLGLDVQHGLEALYGFRPGKHRLQRVRNLHGVEYINDSKATNPHALAAALNSLVLPTIVIAGGVFKGGDFGEAFGASHNVKSVLLFGRDAQVMAAQLDPEIVHQTVDSLDQAVALASEQADRGDVVLLSPACASFDQYQSYQQRGEHFCELVEAL